MLERQFGEVSEWLKEHAWKVCIRQRIGGSNPPLTAIFKLRACTEVRAFCLYVSPKPRGMRTPDRGSTTGAASWTDDELARRLPEGRAQRVNPPLTAIFKLRACTEVRAFCLYVSPKPRGDENTRPGFDNWRSQLDRRRACEETARRASAASQSPPHRHIQERARTKVRAFFSHMTRPLPDGGTVHGRLIRST